VNGLVLAEYRFDLGSIVEHVGASELFHAFDLQLSIADSGSDDHGFRKNGFTGAQFCFVLAFFVAEELSRRAEAMNSAPNFRAGK